MRALVVVVLSLVGVVAVAGAVLVLGMRYRVRVVQDTVRRTNRRLLNPAQLRGDAGQPGAYASVVHHVGRASGRDFATPVVVEPADAGLVVALPYGSGADWVRNVLAADGAVVVHDGETLAVTDPRIVGPDVARRHFPASEQRTQRLFRVDEFLLLAVPDRVAPVDGVTAT